MSGHIVAKYEDYSIWETPISKPQFAEQGAYYIAYSYLVPVASYEDALLEPEWEIFQ